MEATYRSLQVTRHFKECTVHFTEDTFHSMPANVQNIPISLRKVPAALCSVTTEGLAYHFTRATALVILTGGLGNFNPHLGFWQNTNMVP